jgi:uncharacterized cupin superfamily protein
MANIFDDAFTGRLDLSSDETAMFVYDVDPGESFPYHYEYVEEWLLVVDGSVIVREPSGERELRRGEIVRFPAGPEGAHQVTNRSGQSARVLFFSTAALPSVSIYPDTDAVGLWPDDGSEYYFKRGSAISREDAMK